MTIFASDIKNFMMTKIAILPDFLQTNNFYYNIGIIILI